MMLSELQKQHLYILDGLAAGIFLNVDEILIAASKLQSAQQRMRKAISALNDDACNGTVVPFVLGGKKAVQSAKRELELLEHAIAVQFQDLICKSLLTLKDSLTALSASDVSHPVISHTQQLLAESVCKLEQLDLSEQ